MMTVEHFRPRNLESGYDRELHNSVKAIEDIAAPLGHESAGRIIDPDIPARLGSMALGVKPAVLLDKPLPPDIARLLRPQFKRVGIDAKSVRDIVYNPALIQQRLDRQPEFAREVGWDFSKTIDENIRYEPKHESDLYAAKNGFIAGFPASAIRDYILERQLEDAGVPIPAVVLLDWESVNAFSGEEFDRALSRRRPDFMRFYKEQFHLPPEAADFLLNKRPYEITNPAGHVIYGFAAFGEKGARAPDVQHLHAAVGRAYEKAGFFYHT